jgi:hypothetical protein
MAIHSEFVHVGYGGTVAVQRVLAIATPDSSPIKRMIKLANKENRLINLTYGRKAKTVMVLDSGHVVLAALQPNVILKRIQASPWRGGTIDLDASADAPTSERDDTRASPAADSTSPTNL